MKKTLIVLSLACAALLAARDIPVSMDNAKIGAETIPGWILDKYGKIEDLGSGKIVVGSEADDKAFHVVSTLRTTAFFRTSAVPVKIGETFEFSAKIKGKGTVTLGFYGYGKKGAQFLSGIPGSSKTFTLTDTWTEVECKLLINASPDGELDAIRPFFHAGKDTELFIEDVDLEIEEND